MEDELYHSNLHRVDDGRKTGSACEFNSVVFKFEESGWNGYALHPFVLVNG
ncbi:hypothetical protein HanHA89_Chr02g0045761 [Helianthus annuus]|nr:hypothetical protein HanHA89_Chr02g0045761 [Helianthus annuus]